MQPPRLFPRNDFRWQRASLAPDALRGRKAAVIGGTNGIGRALARALLKRGAEVTVVGQTFRDEGIQHLHFLQADLAQMKNARQAAHALPAESLDLLVLTTGIMAGKQRIETPEGLEVDLAVSYLSRFVVVRELAERLGRNRIAADLKPRVFIMGFPGTGTQGSIDDFNSEKNYNAWIAHANTVVGNEALVLDSAKRYPHLNFYGLNPRFIKSNIRAGSLGEGTFRQRLIEGIIGMFFPSAEEYGDKIVPLLVSPDIEHYSGALFDHKGDPIQASPSLTQASNLKNVMDASEQLARRALHLERLDL